MLAAYTRSRKCKLGEILQGKKLRVEMILLMEQSPMRDVSPEDTTRRTVIASGVHPLVFLLILSDLCLQSH